MKLVRFVKYTFLILVAVGLVMIAVANKDPVSLYLIPQGLDIWMGLDQHDPIQVSLFIVVLGGFGAGLLAGYVFEWLREARHRAEAKTQRRAAKQLAREVQTLKGRNNDGKDDVLALVDDVTNPR